MTLHTLINLLSAISTEQRAKVFFHVLESPDPLNSKLVAGIVGAKESVTSYHLNELVKAGWLQRIPSGKYALFIPDRRTLFDLANFFASLVQTYPPLEKPAPSGLQEDGFFTGPL